MNFPRSLHPLGNTLLCLVCLTACGGDDGNGSGAESNETDSGDETDTDATDDSGTEGETGEEPDSNLLEIPGGSFEMGCGASDESCDSDNPGHQVTVAGFSIEATEVTVTAYQACVDDGGCTEPGTSDGCNYGSIPQGNHPINCVTWEQAADYCAWMGRRLPTEAEWEYAATGGTKQAYPWGSTPADCTLAHMYQTANEMGDYGCLTGMTAEVGSYPDGASPVGALDMAGNVEEWVADWYAADYYATSPASDPTGPADGTQRVHRGGDLFDASALNLRVFERSKSNPTSAGSERGFRCAGL